MTMRPLLFVVLSIGLVLSACSPDAPKEELRIGFLATFSGENFRAGRDALEAARYAADVVNDAGGLEVGGKRFRITLLQKDDKASPEQAAALAGQLIEKNNVSALIGPLNSNEALPAAKVADKAGVPLITPFASAPDVTRDKPHIYRIAFTDPFQAKALARFAVGDLGLKTAAVLYNLDNVYSRNVAETFAKAFNRAGGRLTASVAYPDGRRDFADRIKTIVESGAEALLLPNRAKEVVLQGKAAKKNGFTGILLGSDSWDGRQVAELTAFQGAYFIDHWRPDLTDAASRRFAEAFRKKTGRPATEQGALAYDACRVLFEAVKAAKSTAPAAIQKALLDLPPFPGVTGTIDFKNNGDPWKAVFFAHVKDKKIELETVFEPEVD